ncbi:MAG: protein kinase [Mariniblastus sp.]|nr:protein kinase [Mariniblastus sp.]MDG2180585.1 protein kinase [Mariniblastus sp.]
MHGTIYCVTQKFVESNYGNQTWRDLLVQADCPVTYFSPVKIYPDEYIGGIVNAACKALDMKPASLLRELGKFAAAELINFANHLLHPSWKTFEVLSNVETLIHTTIKVQNAKAQPANIQAFRVGENEIEVVYTSRRGLCALAHGIIEGIAKYYEEDISVDQITCTQDSQAFCTFSVKRNTSIRSDANFFIEQLPESPSGSFEGHFNSETVVADLDAIKSATIFDNKNRSDLDFEVSENLQDTNLPKNFGRYEILSLLGTGGMGSVLKARDIYLRRTVALKTLKAETLKDDQVQHFLEEARAMARISSPYVVQIFDVGETDGRPFIVMEYLTGRTLRAKIKEGPIDVSTVIRLLSQITKGLDAVHVGGLVHRDIKPDNIMLFQDEQNCRLLDFGLSHEKFKNKEKANSISGTLEYMSPECLTGLPADYRSDIFSVGTVGYEMLFGSQVFRRFSNLDTIEAVKKFEPEFASGENYIPADLLQLLESMMQKDREKRMANCQEILDRLKAIKIEN